MPNDATLGANCDALIALSGAAQSFSMAIEGVRSTMTTAIGQAFWEGNDAKRFRQEWSEQEIPMLRSLESELTEVSQRLMNDAQRQLSASSN
jgi:hypothetical protein